MKIKITDASFDDERVVVEVTCTGWDELTELADRIRANSGQPRAQANPTELDWAAVRAERDALRDKIGKLEKTLAEDREVSETQEIDEDRAKITGDYMRARERIAELEAELAGEKHQRLENRGWAQALDSMTGNYMRARDRIIELEAQRDRIIEESNPADRERITELEARIAELEAELAGEKHQRLENRGWAERAEAELARRSTEGTWQVDRLIADKAGLQGQIMALKQSLKAQGDLLGSTTRTLSDISSIVAADLPYMTCLAEGCAEGCTEIIPQVGELVTAIRQVREMSQPWSDAPRKNTSQA